MTGTDETELHKAFVTSPRPHVLQVSIRGLQQWAPCAGMADTGGQSVYVAAMARTISEMGFRVTIANRGGYEHPLTREVRSGLRYDGPTRRILFLEDDSADFVRAEDMDRQTPALARCLKQHLSGEGTDPDLVISHGWDGAKVGVLYNRELFTPATHLWVPHSLGMVTKRNVPSDHWSRLGIDDQIDVERELVPELDGIAAISALLRASLREDYGYVSDLTAQPGIDTARFRPREIGDGDEVWEYLGARSGLDGQDVRTRRIVTEIGRTTAMKGKDVLIRAFAEIRKRHSETLLVIAIDDAETDAASELRSLICDLGLEGSVAVLGSVPEILPAILAVTHVYCSPSVSEGFGMAVQEAAAAGVPVVASDRIPFAEEQLLGDDAREVAYGAGEKQVLRIGAAAIVAPANDVAGFAQALGMLLSDTALRDEMGQRARRIALSRHDWRQVARALLHDAGWRVS